MLKFFFSIITLALAILILSRIINVKVSDSGICLYLKDEIKESVFQSRAKEAIINRDRENTEKERYQNAEKNIYKNTQKIEIRTNTIKQKIEGDDINNKTDKQAKSNKINSESEDPIEEIIKKKFQEK